MKHLSLFLLSALGISSLGMAQVVSVEASPAPVDSLGTTYQFFINLESETDKVSAVYGNNQAGLSVQAPEGVYNSELNASWNASGINPAFVALFPELASDTYATIGLTGPASTSGIAGAADPSLVEDPAQPISPFFIDQGATSLESNSVIGASWYLLPTDGNALPQDESLKILVMQVTTTGDISGSLNYQMFPEGNQDSSLQYVHTFNGEGLFEGEVYVQVEGCQDESACNYDPDANFQPLDACNFPDECGECDGEETGPGIADGECDCDGNVEDACGVCGGDNSTCSGCMNPTACNYDPDNDFIVNDITQCILPTEFCDCEEDGDGLAGDEDDDGICDLVDNCFDLTACNYDDPANEDCAMLDACGVCGGPGIADGECDCDGNVEDAIGVCGGDCAEDLDMDGICDDADDCTDTTACNYNVDPTALCLYLDAADSCGGNCFAADSTGCIELIMLGCMDSLACNYDDMVNTDDGSCYSTGDACDDGDDTTINDAWDADCGCTGEAIVDGCTNPDACNYDADANMDDGSCLGTGDACDDMDDNTINDMYNDTCACIGDLIVLGCTDSLACNYSDTANVDDGMCEYLDALDECGGDCFEADSLGNCLETIMLGCIDDMACNYDEMANTDDGSCLFPGDACDDMDDNTTNDMYNDSCVCVGDSIILGCTDTLACNYSMDANADDGSCLIIGESCDDGDDETSDDVVDSLCVCSGTTFVFEFERLEFGMFPNPTTGEVTLRVDGFHAGVTMQIMDGAGRVVWSEQNLALQGNTVFDLSRLSAGTYNVMLSDERGISVKRLAIQK